MIKIENTETYGWAAALRGMRNPLNSHALSDTEYNSVVPSIGNNDMSLCQRLIAAGKDHKKFLRFITVTFDLTAPLYMLKELDTYKVGTVCNSCSTMHKIHAKEFELQDFSTEHLNSFSLDCLLETIDQLNDAREMFNSIENPAEKKFWWWQMIQLLPSSYNQKRTYLLNYEVLRNIYFARRHHKLDEWHTFCAWIESLPYAKELICYEGSDK